MRAILLVTALMLLVPSALAAEEPIRLVVTAHDDAEGAWFQVEGLEGRDPHVRLTPGATYELVFRNEGTQAHNLILGHPVRQSLPHLAPGEARTLTFTAPEEKGDARGYWCERHRAQGMEGALTLGKSRGGLGIPGLEPVSALLVVGLVAIVWGPRRG